MAMDRAVVPRLLLILVILMTDVWRFEAFVQGHRISSIFRLIKYCCIGEGYGISSILHIFKTLKIL